MSNARKRKEKREAAAQVQSCVILVDGPEHWELRRRWGKVQLLRHQADRSTWFDANEQIPGQYFTTFASDLVEMWADLTGRIDHPLVVDFLMLSDNGHPREEANMPETLAEWPFEDDDVEGEEWKRAG